MNNIFNLFLFLLTFWVLLMLALSHLSWGYVLFGIIAAALISVLSKHLKLLEKNSELLYLSLGFYRHFFWIFFANFFSSMRLIFKIAFSRKALQPLLYKVEFNEKNNFNPALLMVSFNMSTGLFCIDADDRALLIHAVSQDYFQQFDMQKMCMSLNKTNDDNLV